MNKHIIFSLSLTALIIPGLIYGETIRFSRASILTGDGYTRVGHSQNLWLNTTPYPGLENNYSSGGQHRGSFMLGVALEQTVKTYRGFAGDIGIEADYMRNPSIQGVVQPMVNVAPDFDTLNYTYEMNTYLLLATGKITKNNLIERLGGYIQLGAGGAVNYLFNYKETSPLSSSAAPMLIPFGDKTTLNVAYSLGFGVFYPLPDSLTFSVGYRYLHAGNANLDTTPVQQTTNHLQFSPIDYQFIIFAISV